MCVCVCRRASQFRANKRKGKPFEKKKKKEVKRRKVVYTSFEKEL